MLTMRNLFFHVHIRSFTFEGFLEVTNNRICITSTIRAQASGSTKSSTAEGIPEKIDSKDDNLVFVAGATGKVGSRTVRELIKLGFKVRVGVRNAQNAGALVLSPTMNQNYISLNSLLWLFYFPHQQ